MQRDRYHQFTSILFGLIAVIALGAAFIFMGSRDTGHAWLSLAICVLTGLMSLIKHELSLPDEPRVMIRIGRA